ncbi:ribonuclease III [Thermospira aquatica]|uniref:Ribonuclease 3 n=1 Tax=Thermospira aquatica TaxID=2828656 RepID=A0AAX3BDD0_9SPIR|nr:ribonuclease III [Thermospira aquatica]URA10238.1 ribonuclease III [Thermospira aquatica]
MSLWFSKNTSSGEISPARRKQLKDLCRKLNVHVKALALLDRAFTHASYSHENRDPLYNYERLEFLGDSVLNLGIAKLLYETRPNEKEGSLSALRSSLVDEKTLFEIAEQFSFYDYLKLGKGESLSDERARVKVLADVMESFLAVYFLEHGWENSFRLIKRLFSPVLQRRLEDGIRDYKSQLQKWALARYKEYPVYKVIGEEGPDHNKLFTVEVTLHNKWRAISTGRSKKDAEQKAAEQLFSLVQEEHEKEKENAS